LVFFSWVQQAMDRFKLELARRDAAVQYIAALRKCSSNI
jgi:hypothetical protein